MGFLVEGEARVAFTNEPGAVPQPPDNGEIKVQQADSLLVTRKADGTARLTDLRPMEEQLADGPLAQSLEAVSSAVEDAKTGFAQGLSTKANLSVAASITGAALVPPRAMRIEQAMNGHYSIFQWVDPALHAGLMLGTNTADLTVPMQQAALWCTTYGGTLMFYGPGPYLHSAQIDFIVQKDGPAPLPDSDFGMSDATPVCVVSPNQSIIRATAPMDCQFNFKWNNVTFSHQAPWWSRLDGFTFDSANFADKSIRISYAGSMQIFRNRMWKANYGIYCDGYGGYNIESNEFSTKWGVFAVDRMGDGSITKNSFTPRNGGGGIRLSYFGGNQRITGNVFTGTGVATDVIYGVVLEGQVSQGQTIRDVMVDRNEFAGLTAFVKIYGKAANNNISNISLMANHHQAYKVVNTGMLIDAFGADTLNIKDNTCGGSLDGEFSSHAIALTSCHSAKISGNNFEGYAGTVIALTDCNDAKITNNTFRRVSTSAQFGAVVNLGGTCLRTEVQHNNVYQSNSLWGQIFLSENGASDFTMANDNKFWGTVQTPYRNTGSAGTNSVMRRVEFGTAPPTTGDYRRGDRIVNSAPSAASPTGWVNVEAGFPGTWKAESNLAA